MISRDGIRVAMTTAGSAAPGFEDLRTNYVYGGDQPEPARREGLGSGPGSTGRREQRIKAFADALRERGHDPLAKFIPTPVLREAGGRVGVGVDTARDYRAEIRRRGGEVRDA